ELGHEGVVGGTGVEGGGVGAGGGEVRGLGVAGDVGVPRAVHRDAVAVGLVGAAEVGGVGEVERRHGGDGEGRSGAAGAGAAHVEDVDRKGIKAFLQIVLRGPYHEVAAGAADAVGAGDGAGGAVAPADDRRVVRQRGAGVGVAEGRHRE